MFMLESVKKMMRWNSIEWLKMMPDQVMVKKLGNSSAYSATNYL